MQCPSCEFQNMPGNTRCLRCGAALQLAAAEIDIEPPRASARSKRLRQWLPGPVTRTGMRAQRGVEAVTGQAVTQWQSARLPDGCLPRLVVPGWVQAYLGDRIQARRFFWGWLGLGLVGIVCFGSQLGSICLGSMLATHAGSIIVSYWRTASAETQFRRGAAAAVCCAVMFTAYGLLGWNVHRVIDSRQWLSITEPFAAGDVVLFRPSAHPLATPLQPGEIVVYHQEGRVHGHTANGHAAVVVFDGEWVDRVIAGPGSQIRWEAGELWVNEQPSDLRPLNPARMPEKLAFTVPEGCYAIFPTTNPFVGPGEGSSAVPAGRILGHALLRNYPPWRIWLLR